MGEFNANRHKPSWYHNIETNQGTATAIKAASKSPSRLRSAPRNQHSVTDVRDVNFWTKVFFNNNNNGSGSTSSRKSQEIYSASQLPAPSATTASTNDTAATKKSNLATTASLLNSILSNAKDNRSKSNEATVTAHISSDRTINLQEFDHTSTGNAITSGNGNDTSQYQQPPELSRKSTYNLPTSIKSRDANAKRKTANVGAAETEYMRNSCSSSLNSANGRRNSHKADNILDLSDSNDTFLRTLNDLRLDYDLLTNRSVQQQSSQSAKEKYVK